MMEKLGSCSEKLDMGDPFLNYFTLVRGGGAVLRHHRDPRYSSPERSSAIIPTRTRSTRVFTLHALWPFLWSGPWRTGTSTGGGSRTNPPRLVQSQRPTRTNWRICGAASQSSKTA